MSSALFNSTSFQYALTFIEHLLQKEENVFNLINLCHNDPTLSLKLHIILEAIETEKLLEESLGCHNDSTLNLHTIINHPHHCCHLSWHLRCYQGLQQNLCPQLHLNLLCRLRHCQLL